jgi:hypothetical protein
MSRKWRHIKYYMPPHWEQHLGAVGQFSYPEAMERFFPGVDWRREIEDCTHSSATLTLSQAAQLAKRIGEEMEQAIDDDRLASAQENTYLFDDQDIT